MCEYFIRVSLPVICVSVSLGYLLDLVTNHYMFLIMIYVVYHYAFVGGAFVFDLIAQRSEFNVCYACKLISIFQIFTYFTLLL